MDPPPGGLQVIQVIVQLNRTLVLNGRLQTTRNVNQEGIVPPGQPSLVQCVFTMDGNIEQRLLHHVPKELAIFRSVLPPPFEISEGRQHVYAGIYSKFQDTRRKVPYDIGYVGLPYGAFILSLQ
jgi:hypothetical protein